MISACTFGTLLAHPESPVVRLVRNPTLLRTLMGLAMGSTSAALVYSKFGKRSGAHLNPSTTFTFLRLGKVEPIDVVFYISAQLGGAILGVYARSIVLGRWLAHPTVDYVVTLPGPYGYWWAFLAEIVITFLLMSVILRVSNTPKLNRYTGLFAASLVMIYISIEAPISGMSMNPGSHFRIRPLSRELDSHLDLLYSATAWNADGRGILCAIARRRATRASIVRQAAPRQPRALHLSVQLSDAQRKRDSAQPQGRSASAIARSLRGA